MSYWECTIRYSGNRPNKAIDAIKKLRPKLMATSTQLILHLLPQLPPSFLIYCLFLAMGRGHKPELTPTTRGRIYQCIQSNIPYRQIARQFNIAPSTVTSIKKRYNERHTLRTKHRSGHPRSVSCQTEQHMASLIRRGKARNAVDLQRSFHKGLSVWTIRRALKRAGLHPYSRRKVPCLTPFQRKVRRIWAKELRNWDFSKWAYVWFSDESKFNLYRSDGRDVVCRERGQAFNPRYTVKTKKFGGGSVMVWGCITPWGVGKLHRITTTMDRHEYVQILSESLLGTFRKYGANLRHVIFQQDNDPKHTSKHAREWFAEKGIKLLPWPSQSPDLNPIESVWDYLACQVSKRDNYPSNPDELWKVLQEEWYRIDAGYIGKLYGSMPKRVQWVIKMKGWNIPY